MFHGSLRGPNGAAGANAPEPTNRPGPVQQVSVQGFMQGVCLGGDMLVKIFGQVMQSIE